MQDGCEVLAIFQGPQAYVTPSWYPSKRETGQVVPTWNYAVVHAYGPLIVRDDREWLRNLVTRLTDQQESALPQPWRVDDAPADYLERMLGAIVGSAELLRDQQAPLAVQLFLVGRENHALPQLGPFGPPL